MPKQLETNKCERCKSRRIKRVPTIFDVKRDELITMVDCRACSHSYIEYWQRVRVYSPPKKGKKAIEK